MIQMALKLWSVEPKNENKLKFKYTTIMQWFKTKSIKLLNSVQ